MDSPKILFIHDSLSSYNNSIYEMINETYNITHSYVEKSEVKNPSYDVFEFPHFRIGPFVIHKNFRSIINQYDIVIINAHLRSLKVVLLPFLPHKPKLISWSIGLHVTYNKRFDLDKSPDLSDRVFQSIQDHCDACIFYMKEPLDYWKKFSKINEKKYFVAHNTVKVADFPELPAVDKRNKFLFVGTLYQQKGLGELIDAYAIAKQKHEFLPNLYIVGKGPEEHIIEQIIKEKGLSNSVIMTGAIYDESILKDYFLTSILCISPKQAGLSVQKSLGYGTPFVTRPDAITGGERFDIHHNENGFFYHTIEELSEIMIYASKHPEQMGQMSIKARHYYLTEASPEKMVEGALKAIKYVAEQI